MSDNAGPDLIALHKDDTVATALKPLQPGVVTVLGVDGRRDELPLRSAIGLGHKAALGAIRHGDLIVKHGYPIGRATADIAPGEHVHVHNVISLSRDQSAATAGAES
ncbi:MAG: UxaA family hydrolase [Thermomicrobiales bacterium]